MKSGSEQSKKDDNITYAISHTLSRGLARGEGRHQGKNHRFDLEREAFTLLWDLRNEEDYLAYMGNDGLHKLADLIGDFPNSSELLQAFDPLLTPDIYLFSRMSAFSDEEDQKIARIPELDHDVRRGILTDIVACHGELVRAEAIPEIEYQKDINGIVKRAGITSKEAEDASIARFNYYLYSVGYLLPHVRDEKNQEYLLKNYAVEIKEPAKVLKERYKLKVSEENGKGNSKSREC
ncbi:MAG TPA: hypothetical protein HA282_05400 [Nanoarchaeota archaeon]|nr:MAG: hypothetical protein QT01_C0001G0149 [archaeon GW2011_AR6]MBS3082940.1 hypothetical protein [Candidatus Pacearchaeota archaeon]HIH17575.1 hypothetical protein [Nanoarchaeota archaeon]HIH33898.1 hypothetical protein [Nanoarchaeota archaeon]HIH51103.1 hypothetical protein [Nanoarchaeota archaeon]